MARHERGMIRDLAKAICSAEAGWCDMLVMQSIVGNEIEGMTGTVNMSTASFPYARILDSFCCSSGRRCAAKDEA